MSNPKKYVPRIYKTMCIICQVDGGVLVKVKTNKGKVYAHQGECQEHAKRTCMNRTWDEQYEDKEPS